MKVVVVRLITFTNTSPFFPFVCDRYFLYSFLTLPLVHLTQLIRLYLVLFCDPV